MLFFEHPVLFLMLGVLFWAFVIRKGFKMLLSSKKSGPVKRSAINLATRTIERMLK